MIEMEVSKSPAITGDVPIRIPLTDKDILQECLADTSRFPICPVIRTHDTLDP
ncbi:MAG: hypothetical protein WBI82_06765 [Sphaerochaeta sp.]